MRERIIKAVEELNEQKTYSLVERAFREGYDQAFVISCIQAGMNCVGKLYENSTYYIADLIMAGLIFRKVLEMEQMKPQNNDDEPGTHQGVILLGTVERDIHDIGKDLFAGIARASGFRVIDLGVDVKREIFVDNIYKHQPDIVGLSGILTVSVKYMKETIDAITQAGLRECVKIIVGGNNILPEEGVSIIGSDAYAKDANEGIAICRRWMAAKRG